MKKKPITEVELAKYFIEYFADNHEIYQEVPASGIIDIVAVSGNIRIAIEVKTRLSFDVIEQAFMAHQWTHYSYVAVPMTRVGFADRVCGRFGIGILQWDQFSGVRQHTKSKFNRNPLKLRLNEYMKESVAGSQNDRVTAFGATIKAITKHLKNKGGADSLDNTLNAVDFHWNTINSAKSCLYQWCKKGIITDFRLEKKQLILNKTEA